MVSAGTRHRALVGADRARAGNLGAAASKRTRRPPAHPPGRGQGFPGSHGPSEHKVKREWLVDRYRRRSAGALAPAPGPCADATRERTRAAEESKRTRAWPRPNPTPPRPREFDLIGTNEPDARRLRTNPSIVGSRRAGAGRTRAPGGSETNPTRGRLREPPPRLAFAPNEPEPRAIRTWPGRAGTIRNARRFLAKRTRAAKPPRRGRGRVPP
jgi:hypothetical protein